MGQKSSYVIPIASIIGHDFKSQLKAATLTSPDIRAGISLLIAALSAQGTLPFIISNKLTVVMKELLNASKNRAKIQPCKHL